MPKLAEVQKIGLESFLDSFRGLINI